MYNSGDGFDTVEGFSTNTTLQINGGDGNDYIYSSCCNNISINSGTGNGSVYISTYTSSGVAHYSNNVTIALGDGDNYLQNVGGNHILINAGDGNILLEILSILGVAEENIPKSTLEMATT